MLPWSRETITRATQTPMAMATASPARRRLGPGAAEARARLDRSGGRLGCAGGILQRTDFRDHAVAEARDGLDVVGLLGVVAELAAQRGHGLIDGVGADDYAGPNLVDQFVDADNFAGTVGEAKEKAHCADVEAGDLALARDFAGGGVDLPVTDEEFGGWLLGHSDF